MGHTIRDIAAALGAEAEGALDLTVRGAAEPAAAGPDQLALAMDPRYGEGIARGRAQAGSALGAFSTSTRHMRQLAAMDSFLW